MRGPIGSSGSDLARTMPQQATGRNLRMAGARESPLSTLSPLAIEFRGALPTAAQTIIASPGHGEIRRMDDVRERFQNLHEYIKAEKFSLNRNICYYIVGSTETETTLARNRQSLDSIAF